MAAPSRDIPFSKEEQSIYDIYRRKERTPPDWQRCGLLIVDATEGFFGPNLPTLAAARQNRSACGAPAWNCIPAIQTLLRAFRAAHRPVVYTTPIRTAALGAATVGTLVNGEGDPIMSAVAPSADELVLTKSKPSAFFGTPLVTYLVRHKLSSLVVAGGTTSGCVRATAVDAASYGLTVVLASDACFDRSTLSHSVTLYELEVKYASVLSANEIAARVGDAVSD